MDKRQKTKRIFRYIISICFATFFAIYISQSTGYAEYQNRKQVALTAKQIKKFETDVEQGKQIDLKKYLKTNNQNYQNGISKIGLKISKTAGNTIKSTVEKSFKFLSKLSE